MTELKNGFSRQEKAATLVLFSANLVLFLTLWLGSYYDHVYLDQCLFQMQSSSTGVHHSLVNNAAIRVGVYGVVLTALETALYWFFSGRMPSRRLRGPGYVLDRLSSLCGFLKNHALPFTAGLLAAALLLLAARVDLLAFVKAASAESDFIESHYVEPSQAVLRFPEQKRNLIYIFLESMESTYADPAAGEPIAASYIPELEALAGENVNFSHHDGLGGALSYAGTTWTAAAMVAQTSGVVVKVIPGADVYGAEDVFLPGATSIGEILEGQGYRQVLLLGSDAEFHGRRAYFTEHGNYEILDTNALKAAGRLPEDYDEWWGFEDEKLFAYAKEELTRLAEEDRPFNLTMLTADTHFPDGYRCRLCRDTYDAQYANVLSCSSRQVAEFVAWIQEQPFYENTTIVISGDHLTMDSEFMDHIDPAYTRTVYNCFINAPVEPEGEKNRSFGTFDLFPTTLAALGVEIEGNRLALGTNLFSGEPTLTEQYGYEYLLEELQKSSEYYDVKLLGKE